MHPLSLTVGILIGLGIGTLISKFLFGKSMQDAEAIAENLSSKIVSKQTEKILQLAESKLSGGSRPDFTFMLPKNLKLNMDVKFPFNNYQVFTEATTEAEREKAKKEFLADVKRRIKEVQTRDYINSEDQTVDYVLLFVPNEQIYTFINEIDSSVMDEAMRGKTILCSPMTLYAILAVIRQSIDNFSLEIKSKEMLGLFGAFKQQWEKFKEQMTTVQQRFELAHKGYEELTGTRERMLDRQLTKIEELRSDQSALPETIETAFEKVSKKKLTEVSS